MTPSASNATHWRQGALVFRIAVAGTVAVAAYATLAVLQILVLNPLAAAPGRDLAQIQHDLATSNESLRAPFVLAVLAFGLVLAVALLVVLPRMRGLTPSAAAFAYLLLLVLGAPAYVAASFGAGMALADTYGIGGGDHSPWARPLLWTSALSLLGAGVLGAAELARLRRRRTHSASPPGV